MFCTLSNVEWIFLPISIIITAMLLLLCWQILYLLFTDHYMLLIDYQYVEFIATKG